MLYSNVYYKALLCNGKGLAKSTFSFYSFLPTFTHGAHGSPGLVWPACDGAAPFNLMALWTCDADRLSNMEHLPGDIPAGILPPTWMRWAGHGCEEKRWWQDFFNTINIYSSIFHTVCILCKYRKVTFKSYPPDT